MPCVEFCVHVILDRTGAGVVAPDAALETRALRAERSTARGLAAASDHRNNLLVCLFVCLLACVLICSSISKYQS